MSKTAFHTIARSSEGLYKEKGSKFYSKAYPIHSEEDIKSILTTIRKEFYDARHVCYAFSLQETQGVMERGNDDGEPSHSAGTPILNQIRSFEFSNVLVVVIRYFGGTKLGVSGLIQAYKTAAEEALKKAERICVEPKDTYRITLPYEYTGTVMRWIKELNAKIIAEEKTEHYVLEVESPIAQEALWKEKWEPFAKSIDLVRVS